MSTAAPPDLEGLSAAEVMGHAVERFGRGLALACSFQKESSVLIDLAVHADPSIRVFTLDTGFFFPETYDTWRALESRYDIEIESWQGPTPARQEVLHGPELWKRDPDACCGMRKVEPLGRALAGAEAWMTGLRRDQSETRANTPKIGWDIKHEMWKLAPLADWTDKDVWRHLVDNDVPYNPLHDQGYGSIGCTHCTLPGEGRSGRWAGSGKIECGIHGS